MTDTTFGPEIAVNGKRPDWLGGGVTMQWAITSADGSHAKYHPASSDTCVNWVGTGYGVAIRLPADHPHYAATPADTVQIARMTEAEAKASLPNVDYSGINGLNWMAGWMAAHRALGIIIRPETTAERFTRETGHEVTPAVEAALAWDRGK